MIFQVFAQLVSHCSPFNSLNRANSTIFHPFSRMHLVLACRRPTCAECCQLCDQFCPATGCRLLQLRWTTEVERRKIN